MYRRRGDRISGRRRSLHHLKKDNPSLGRSFPGRPVCRQAGGPGTVQTAIIQALARAFSWAEVIESGEVKSISELATNLDVDNSYVARILKLTTLAPDIIEAILNGEEPAGLWWIICDYNGIFFPMELEPGTVLRIPSVEHIQMHILG